MDRYERQITYSNFGRRGQERLAAARVLVVGAGGLGSTVTETLVRMGVGTIRVVDRDYVELSNLHRQSTYDEQDARDLTPKVYALRDHLRRINSQVTIEAELKHVDPFNVRRLLKGVDLVVDGCDSLDLRLLLNEACVRSEQPFVFGAVAGAAGMVMGIRPSATACLRCLMEQTGTDVAVVTGRRAGIFPPTARAVASLQATLAIRHFVGDHKDWGGKLLTMDLWRDEFDELRVRQRTGSHPCPVCVKRRFEIVEAEKPAGPLVGVDEDQINIVPERKKEPDFQALRARMRRASDVRLNEHLLWARIGDLDMVVFRDGRVSVRGASDWAEAVHLYERYFAD